jgi:Trk-type K+ transport system membrane component
VIPALPGQEPAGFTVGPELWLLVLGVVATVGVALIFLVVIRRMIREERDELAQESEGDSVE